MVLKVQQMNSAEEDLWVGKESTPMTEFAPMSDISKVSSHLVGKLRTDLSNIGVDNSSSNENSQIEN